MPNERLFEDIPKIVLQHYDMSVHSGVKEGYSVKSIYVWIVFTPKKISTLTPKPTNFYAKYKYSRPNDTDRLSYEDAIYIRTYEMPLIRYITGEYYLDEFCEKLAREVTEDIVEKIKSGDDSYTKIPMDSKVYIDYWKNDF